MLLITSVVVGAFLVGLAEHCRKRKRNTADLSFDTDPGNDLFIPFLFDRPSRWLTVKCSNIIKVQNALGLGNPTPCSWTDGFSKVSERKLFISPPVQGWIMIVGQGLPEPSDDIDELYHFLMKLARDL